MAQGELILPSSSQITDLCHQFHVREDTGYASLDLGREGIHQPNLPLLVFSTSNRNPNFSALTIDPRDSDRDVARVPTPQELLTFTLVAKRVAPKSPVVQSLVETATSQLQTYRQELEVRSKSITTALQLIDTL